jgi:hypothetical protein
MRLVRVTVNTVTNYTSLIPRYYKIHTTFIYVIVMVLFPNHQSSYQTFSTVFQEKLLTRTIPIWMFLEKYSHVTSVPPAKLSKSSAVILLKSIATAV